MDGANGKGILNFGRNSHVQATTHDIDRADQPVHNGKTIRVQSLEKTSSQVAAGKKEFSETKGNRNEALRDYQIAVVLSGKRPLSSNEIELQAQEFESSSGVQDIQNNEGVLDSLERNGNWVKVFNNRSLCNEQVIKGSETSKILSHVDTGNTVVSKIECDQNRNTDVVISQSEGNDSFIVIDAKSGNGAGYMEHDNRALYQFTTALAGKKPMSYKEINATAEQLKHSLGGRDVQNDDGSLGPLNTTEITDGGSTWVGYLINVMSAPFIGYLTSSRPEE